MFDFHEKRKIKAILFSRVTLILLLIPIVFLGLSVFDLFQKEREVSKRRIEREGELHRLHERAAVLEANVEMLESDRGIEAEIRDRYDVAKEGETVVVIIEHEERVVVPVPEEEEKKDPWFSALKFW